MFVKQGMTIAAYEGAHRGLQVGGTAADAIAIANEILEQRRIQGATVTVTPSDIPGLDIGEFFTVEVVAQSSQNRLVPLPLFSLGEMTAKAVAMKEYPADE